MTKINIKWYNKKTLNEKVTPNKMNNDKQIIAVSMLIHYLWNNIFGKNFFFKYFLKTMFINNKILNNYD